MNPSKKPTAPNGFGSLLRNRSFLWLWTGQILSQIADKILIVLAISLLPIYQVPTASIGSFVSAISIANTLPAIFFGAAAGILADRYLKKQVMVYSNLMRAVLVPLIVLLPKQFALFGLLLLVIFAISTVTQFFTPAEQSILPSVVEPENLLTANALFTVTQLGSVTVGFAIGEPLLHQIGANFNELGKVLFLGGSYLLAAICCQMMNSTEVRPKGTGKRSINPIPEIRAGLQYLQGNRPVLNAIVQIVILYSTIAALQILSVYLGKAIGFKPEQFGFLVAATGVGLLIGAALIGQWGSRLQSRPLPLIGFSITLMALVGYILFKIRWASLLISVILGFGAALVAVPMQTLIQEKTPESMRGKVFGFENNVVNIALSLPLALAGICADRYGLNAVLIAMILALSLTVLWVWRKDRQIVPPLS
jgi:predicted MFS family arabinose efflux permease